MSHNLRNLVSRNRVAVAIGCSAIVAVVLGLFFPDQQTLTIALLVVLSIVVSAASQSVRKGNGEVDE